MNARRERAKQQKASQNKQIETSVAPKENQNENKTIIELGEFCLDLAKLVFGGVILTVLLDYRDYKLSLLVTGMVFVFVFVSLGLMLVEKGRKK